MTLGTETRLGHRHVMIYQRNIMGTLIYHNMSVSQSCLRSVPFCAIPIFPFKFPKFFIYLSPIIFFLDLGTCILLFLLVLANRACSLRLSNINCLCTILRQIFSGAFVNDILQSSAWGYYLQDYKILSQY